MFSHFVIVLIPELKINSGHFSISYRNHHRVVIASSYPLYTLITKSRKEYSIYYQRLAVFRIRFQTP